MANLCGRGFVAEENRPMKSLNYDTHDTKKWHQTLTLLCCFIFLTGKEHKNKKRSAWVRRWLLDK